MRYELITPKNSDPSLGVVERILTNRGIKLEDIEHYLNPSAEDLIPPLQLDNMERGLKILLSHIAHRHQIYLRVDPDCDGFTSAALFLNYLNAHFPHFAQTYIKYEMQEGKQHGLTPDDIPDILSSGCQLVVMLDSCSNDYEAHKMLADAGIDVLVIDHHHADEVSQDACVINNQLCDYPNKELSGVGVVWKFCCYLDEYLETNYAEQFIDLAAVGIIADMMELRQFETRYLVTQGLSHLRNPYLKGMTEHNSFSIERGGGLNPFTISFYVAPYVNATIRVGTQDEKLILFESMLDFKAEELIPSTKRGCKGQFETRVEQACRNCTNLKNRQNKARDASLDMINRKIENDNLLDHKILVVQIPKVQEINSNITGLIANQIAATYQRPTLLLNERQSEDGELLWAGSARNYSNSAIADFRQYVSDTGLTQLAQGHGSAFGFSILEADLAEFWRRTDENLKDFDFSPCYKVDYIFQGKDFRGNDILKIAELKSIWGQGVEEALIAIEDLHVSANNVTLMSRDKNPTLKITLDNGTSLIKFGSSEEEYTKLVDSDLGCVNINVVGKCDRNEWNGRISPQIHVEDYEIVGVKKYYF